MAERKKLTKTQRFEVFKRDGFKCQYCGRSAPEVILEVDHIIPVAEGGKNDILNLITSCKDCNRGKGKRLLSDTKTIDLQRQQFEDMNEMREQMKMMIDWKKELMRIEEEQLEALNDLLRMQSDYELNEAGLNDLRRLIHRFGFSEVYDAFEIALDKYYYEGDSRSIREALKKTGGICYNRRNQRRANE